MEYALQITHDDDVHVIRRDESIAFRLVGATLVDDLGRTLVDLRSVRRFPRFEFTLVRDGQVAGLLRSSLLRTRWSFELTDGPQWSFFLPLFSVHFHAVSSEAKAVVIRVVRQNLWFALLGPDADSPLLIAVLARLQLARWHS